MRKILFWGHLTAGLSMGLMILFMCVTGTILAYQPQINNWAERDLLKVTLPAPDAEPLESEIILASVRKANPDSTPTILMFKEDREASAMVWLGKEGILYVDPYTGGVLGKGSHIRHTIHDIEEWHRWLGNKKIGRPITATTAIVFFLLSLSGIYLWWPRKAYTLRGDGHASKWNWHNTLGITLVPFVLLITVTGLIMSFNGYKKDAAPRPQTEQKVRVIKPQPQTNAWPNAKALHTGRAWGWPGQTVNVLVAFAGMLQIWTGFALAWSRFRRRQRPA